MKTERPGFNVQQKGVLDEEDTRGVRKSRLKKPICWPCLQKFVEIT